MVGAPATSRFDDPTVLLAAVLHPTETSGLVLLGEAGRGKSRLLHAVRVLAEHQGFPVREINPTDASGSVPFGCLADLLFRCDVGRVPLVDLRFTDSRRWDPRLLLHLVVAALCAEASPAGRLLLFVDDVPRLDPCSAAALHYTLKASQAFLVGTASPDDPWPPDLALLRDQGVIATATLGPVRGEAPVLGAAQVLSLRRSGRRWRLEFRGVGSTLRHLVGLVYLARLIEQPTRPIPALQLVSAEAPVAAMSPQPVIDAVTRRSLEQRALDLIDALARLRGAADDDRVGELEAEALWIERLLTTSSRPNGSSRVFATIDERARTAVRKAIVRALDEIGAADAAAAGYLRPRVSTGFECCFNP